jgi:hypothetical protein
VTHIADLALRFLVRTDWSGVEALSIPGPEDLSCDEATAFIEGTF